MSNHSDLIKALPLMALMMTAGLGAGCGKDTETVHASPVSVELAAASAASDETTVLGNPADLVSEFADLVELTDDQKSALTAALENLQTAMAERRGAGRRQGPPSPDEERPLRTFLITSAEILDPTQTALWFDVLAEERAARMERRGNRLGDGFGPRAAGHRGPRHQGPPAGDFERPEPGEMLDQHLSLLTAVLELTEAQAADLRNALTALIEQWQTAREGLEPGTQEWRDAAQQHREAVRAAIDAELTDQQRAVFQAMQGLQPQPRGPRRG